MAHRPEPRNVKLTKIKEYLDKNKMTYASLGRALGYSRDYIARIIKKQRPLTEEFVMRFRDFMIQEKKKHIFRNFKCYRCGTLILTSEKKIKCECGEEYTFEDGKFYRENVYSKMYKNFRK